MTDLFSIPAACAALPVPKTIEWEQNGQTHQTEVYFKPLSWQAVYGRIGQEDEQASDLIARRLAGSLCDKNGETLYTPEQIQGQGGKALCTPLITALLIAMNEVNGEGKP